MNFVSYAKENATEWYFWTLLVNTWVSNTFPDLNHSEQYAHRFNDF